MQPSDAAQEAARTLVSSTDVQREVLEEAAETGTESGRTICGERPEKPRDRGFNHVSLPGCALKREGLIHGGGGHDFEDPEHSLIDMAIVLYGRPAASMVVGSKKSDLFLTPDEESLREARGAFSEEVGGAESVEGVKEAIESGAIDPPASRRRVRQKLPELFMESEADHTKAPAGGSVAASTSESGSLLGVVKDLPEKVMAAAEDLWRFLKQTFSADPRDVDVNLVTLLATEIASAAILLLFLRVFGGSPTSMVGP